MSEIKKIVFTDDDIVDGFYTVSAEEMVEGAVIDLYHGSKFIRRIEVYTGEQIFVDGADKTKKYDIWCSGYYITGMEGKPEPARFIGSVEAGSFREACIKACKDEMYFDEKTLRIWGCSLHDNEEDARRQFG